MDDEEIYMEDVEDEAVAETQPGAPGMAWGTIPLFPVRVTYGLIVINVLVFLLDLLSGHFLLWMGGIIPPSVVEGEYWRLLTAGFLHFSLQHIAFNMWALYVLGHDLEKLYGWRRFLGGYLVSLLAGSLMIAGLQDMNSISAGASGAIMGMAGMLIVYLYRYRLMWNTRFTLNSLVRMVAINLAIGLLPGVSLWGHLGGVLGGLAAGLLLCPGYEWNEERPMSVRIRDLTFQQIAYLGALGFAMLSLTFLISMLRG